MGVGGGFIALGGLAQGLSEAAETHRKAQQDRDKATIDMLGQIFTQGISSGQVEDPNQALAFLAEMYSDWAQGKKPKLPTGRLAQNPYLARVGSAINLTDQGLPGPTLPGAENTANLPTSYPLSGPQAQPYGLPRLLGRSELLQRKIAEAVQIQRAEKVAGVQTSVALVDEIKRQIPGISDALARRYAGLMGPVPQPKWQPGTTPGHALPSGAMEALTGEPIDPGKYYRTRELEDGTKEFYPTTSPVTSIDKEVEQRASDYVSQGFTRDEALRLAHEERQKERGNKAKALAQRVTLNDLLVTERRDVLAGTITMGQALTIATRIASTDPSMTREETIALARELYQRLNPGQGAALAPRSDPDQAALDAQWAALPHPSPNAPAGTTTPEEVAFWQAHPEYVGRRGGGGASTAPAQGATPAPAQAGARTGADLLRDKFKSGLTVQQKNLVDAGDTALQLMPQITQLIEKAGLQDEMGKTPGAKQRWEAFLYAQGFTANEFQLKLQQVTGAVQAYTLVGLLRGQPRVQLINIFGRHIPDPAVDPPGLIYRKIHELADIIRISTETTVRHAQMTPDQLLKEMETSFEKANLQTDRTVAQRRLRARQTLLDAQKTGTVPSTVVIDEKAIDTFLKNNPAFK